jgi:flagellar motor switch protein FliN
MIGENMQEPDAQQVDRGDGVQASARDLLLQIELDATLQFGSRELQLRDILALGPGDVLELNRHVSEPVDLVVGDRIVARGEVVVVDGNFALLVTDVAEPQLRLESIRPLF